MCPSLAFNSSTCFISLRLSRGDGCCSCSFLATLILMSSTCLRNAEFSPSNLVIVSSSSWTYCFFFLRHSLAATLFRHRRRCRLSSAVRFLLVDLSVASSKLLLLAVLDGISGVGIFSSEAVARAVMTLPRFCCCRCCKMLAGRLCMFNGVINMVSVA